MSGHGRAPTAEEVGMLDRVLGSMLLGGVDREDIEDAVRTGLEMWEAEIAAGVSGAD